MRWCRISRRFRKTLYVLGGLAALAALGLIILSSPWAQHRFERSVIAALEAATGAKAQVRRFRFRPLSLEFVLTGLVLHGNEPAGSAPMFSGKTVIVRLRPRAVIERKPLFASLDWDEAEIHVYAGPDGSTNLPSIPPRETGSAPASIGRVTLSKTDIFWNDQRLHVGMEASNLAILVRPTASGKYAGSVSATQVQIRGPKADLPRISFIAQAEFSRAGLTTQALSWQCAGLIGRGNLSVIGWTPLNVRFAYQTEGDIQELAGLLELRDIRQGKGQIQGTLTYESGKLETQGKIALRQMEIQTGGESLKGVSASANFATGAGRVLIQDMAGTLLDGSFRGSGEILLKDPAPEYRFQARADRISLSRFIQTLGMRNAGNHISSRVSGTVTAAWTGYYRGFSGRYNLKLSPGGGERAGVLAVGGTVEGTARFAPAFVMTIRQAEIRTRASAVSARGTLGTRQAKLALGVSISDFEEWRPLIEPWIGAQEPVPLKLGSVATFRGEVAGPLRSLGWRGELSSGPFEFQSTRWDKLEAGITITPDVIQVAAGRLYHGDSQLRLETELPIQNGKLDPVRPLRLSVNAEKTRLEGLLAALGRDIPLRGSLTGSIQLQGSLENANGTGQVRLEHGTLYEEPFSALSASIVVERSVYHLNDVTWAKGKGLARGTVEIDYPARQFRLGLSGSGLNLNELRQLHASLDIPSTDLQGLVEFNVRAQGWTNAIDLDATAGIRDILVKNVPIGDMTGRLTRKGDQSEFSVRGEGPGGNIRFSGAKPSIADGTFSLDCEYRGLRLDPWLQVFASRESAPRIIADGSLRGKLSPADWGSSEISAQSTQFSIEYPTLALSAAGPVNVRYAARRLTIDRFNLKGPSTSLEVEGSAHFGQGGSLALQAEGTAEATLLSLVDPALQASGASLLKVRVTGSFARPALHGSMSVQNVNAGYGDLPFRVTGLTGNVLLEGDRATLRSLEGTSGGGRVVLNGYVDFGASTRFNVQAGLTQVRVRYPSVFTSMLDGTLRLASSAERGEISGDLIVRQMFPPENFNWLAHVSQAGSSVGFSRSAMQSPIAPRIRLNIRVKSSPAVRFEARDLRLVGDIDIRLQGTLAEPVEVGHVQLLNGEAVFRGNRYNIRRGDISMTNPFRTETTLTLEADTRIQRYNLTVNLSGPFDRLKITYRSDPPLPTSDIVTLLAFGYAHQQEEMSTTGSSHPAATVGASAIVSQALSTQMSGRIQRLFGVSRIKIDPNAGGVATTGGALITVEQQVAPELTITYVTNTGVSQYRIIRLEWAVSDRMSIIGERDQGGVFGMEVQFRRRFR